MHFWGWNLRGHFLSHECSLFKSSCIFWQSSFEFILWYSLASSKNSPASNATSGVIVTTLASVTTVAVTHPTSRRRWLQITGSTVCHLTLQRRLRQWTQSVLASSARRSPPDGRNPKTTCKFTITKIKIMFDLVCYCCKTTFEAR